MKLKQYQIDTLAVLRRYFEEARVSGPKNAYESIVQKPEQQARLGAYGGEYRSLEGLPNVPYICLRLPTGGGKTILGAYSIAVARDAWVEKDYPLVLWLVPTNTIRIQTAEALKNTKHPYRQVLDEVFEGRVRIFDIKDFSHIRPQDIRDNLCVVVGTIQSLRVSNTDGRKVYADNENLEPHYSAIPPAAPGLDLERVTDGPTTGDIKFSFANLLHIHRPLMIVDEAHNAVTGLTREMQQRVNPCAIIEFTATPRLNSNTLHNVTAQELKLEEMIKLPIMLSEHDTWQNAVNGAVNSRAALEDSAKSDKDYIRPIVLFQAQPRNQEVTVNVLKQHLIDVEQIPEERIAVATGDQRELDGIDLFDQECPVEYVITMEALKEGWDCSFAYVFCTVSNIQSATDIEQLLGRVLRMPYAVRRKADDLNRAYAHVCEPTFQAAAKALVDKLISMGFEEDEALDNIEPTQERLLGDEDLFGPKQKSKPTFTHIFDNTPEVVEALKAIAGNGVVVRESDGDKIEISVTGGVKPALEKALTYAVPKPEHKGLSEAIAHYRIEVKDQLSPAEQGETFIVPRLVTEVQGELLFPDEDDLLLETGGWTPLDHPARLEPGEFSVRETARSFEIDLDGNQISCQFASETEQHALDIDVEGWTGENLAIWLDKTVRQLDLNQIDLLKWLRDLVSNLTGPRKLHIAALMRCKFILARKVRDKLADFRKQESDKAFQRYLFEPDAKVEISFEDGFEFRDGMYWDQRRYRGRLKFRKHFLGPDNVPVFDGSQDGEEVECATSLDSLSEVKYWVRNVARHPNSFRLPTASDNFYPDFVAELIDGRLLIVEYKGAHLADTADTNEKRTIGRLWEQRSDGKGLFIVAEKEVDGKDVRAQLQEKVEA